MTPCVRARWATWPVILFFLCATGAARAADPELIAPRPGQDLSAYRFDCDVFGWNDKGTEVGAVGMEVTRGPNGRHRGTAFLLVYQVGQTIPMHNVNTHVITHADFPDNPVPLDTAEDLMWTIENEYLSMWPKRPKHHRPAHGMHVDLIWDLTLAPASQSTDPNDTNAQNTPLSRADETCTPTVGFILNDHGHKRIMPHQKLDMQARCSLLKKTDARIYWLNDKIAAAMVRFDFSPKPDNEQSARFVVSAAWHLAEALRFEVRSAVPLDAVVKGRIQRVVRQYGSFATRSYVAEQKKTDKGSALQQLHMITAPAAFVTLAKRIGEELGQPNIWVQVAPNAKNTLILHYAKGALKQNLPPRPQPSVDENRPQKALQVHVFGADVVAPLQDIAPPDTSRKTPMPHDTVLPPAEKTRPPTGKDYLGDWKVP